MRSKGKVSDLTLVLGDVPARKEQDVVQIPPDPSKLPRARLDAVHLVAGAVQFISYMRGRRPVHSG